MPRRKSQPAEGGAITESAVPTGVPPVNPQVLKMTGFQSEKEMEDSLPTNTVVPVSDAPKRSRRTRAEMEAARGGAPSTANPNAIDPLLADRRYQRAIGKATFFGAPKAVKGGFKIAATVAGKEDIALNVEESEDIDDFFYALSKRRATFDPFATWWSSLLYFVALIATLIGSRVAASHGQNFQKQLAKMFGFGEQEDKTAEDKEGE